MDSKCLPLVDKSARQAGSLFGVFSSPIGDVRGVATGVLKIKAKIGELLPAKSPANRGQGRNGKSVLADRIDSPFDKNTITAYRKLAANAKRIDALQPPPLGAEAPTCAPKTACLAEAVFTAPRFKRDFPNEYPRPQN